MKRMYLQLKESSWSTKIFFSVILITILLQGCSPPYNDPCAAISNSEEKATCYYPIVNNLKNPDASICASLQDPLYKDVCFINVAVFKPDVVVCEKVSEGMRDSCYLEIVKGPSPPQDLTFCDKIRYPDWKQHCIEVIGKNIEDATAMERITSHAVEQRNASLCRQLIPPIGNEDYPTDNRTAENYNHLDCVTAVAVSNADVSICETEKLYIDTGMWHCYDSVAVDQKDKAICLKITDPTWQEECIKSVE